jgi:hypothetical protein
MIRVPSGPAGKVAACVLLKDQWRLADSLALEIDFNLDPVCNLDKGDALIHSVVLTVEGHCPFGGPKPVPLPEPFTGAFRA